jgi:hypothetical protein
MNGTEHSDGPAKSEFVNKYFEKYKLHWTKCRLFILKKYSKTFKKSTSNLRLHRFMQSTVFIITLADDCFSLSAVLQSNAEEKMAFKG